MPVTTTALLPAFFNSVAKIARASSTGVSCDCKLLPVTALYKLISAKICCEGFKGIRLSALAPVSDILASNCT